ncbi:hypothetical protein VH570_10730 [Sphingobium sp. HT1-2]|uniref:hypothetical protein n=1 Tax=Sphingobium sp. HT1-2 TaxID=3111640 RepID=UPI003C02BC76
MGQGLNRRAFALAALALGAMNIDAAAAREKQLPASEEEKQAAIQQMVECFRVNAPNYDDGVSDASTIGTAVASSCNADILSAADVVAQGQNQRTQYYVRENFVKNGGEIATRVVLQVRTAK